MQAIQTEYVGRTEKKPAKIVAKAGVGKISIPFDAGLSEWQNHANAARKIAIELGWQFEYVGGSFGGVFYWAPVASMARFSSVPEPMAQEPVEAAQDASVPLQATPVAANPESAPVEPVKAPSKARRAA